MVAMIVADDEVVDLFQPRLLNGGQNALRVAIGHLVMVAFVLSAVFAGLAGGTFTLFQSFINPDSVGLAQLILVLTMVVVGGSGSIAGVPANREVPS